MSVGMMNVVNRLPCATLPEIVGGLLACDRHTESQCAWASTLAAVEFHVPHRERREIVIVRIVVSLPIRLFKTDVCRIPAPSHVVVLHDLNFR